MAFSWNKNTHTFISYTDLLALMPAIKRVNKKSEVLQRLKEGSQINTPCKIQVEYTKRGTVKRMRFAPSA